MDLTAPGTYVHVSILQISVANLALIGVMVVIFGAALLLPFPGSRHAPEASGGGGGSPATTTPPPTQDPETARMWTARLRSRLTGAFPYDRLLPDRQPAYVASWIYVFGVATLAALGVVVVSGFAIAIGGPDWWHTNVVGHFFNSLHLWSVELFMAFMVIHLWGKFWMAAWRGRRAATWMTGVVAFMASVVECFTGYLSQSNYDSQWISTNGKDAFNAVGVGGFFNLMNVGQMLLWHVVLLPIALIALIGGHVLLVRRRGVAHPLPARMVTGREARRRQRAADAAEWSGPTRRYDILKEGTIATALVLVLTVVLAGFLSSPDEPSITVQSWAKVAPGDFLATTSNELAGATETANYGPPYNHQSGSVQLLGPHWQLLMGVRQPVNAPQTFVLGPLAKLAVTDPSLMAALHTYEAAPSATQVTWATNYTNALTSLGSAPLRFVGGQPVVPKADDGPVPVLAAGEYALARSGALDADLLAQHTFYGTDYTKPLLFLEDGSFWSLHAKAQHLTGAQWGVMNETGSYPGQPWLWLYTLWYQLPGWRDSSVVDLIAIYMTALATLLLLLVPFIPGLRDVPRLVPVHRLVWRRWGTSAGTTID